jgi:hypothetical protein
MANNELEALQIARQIVANTNTKDINFDTS